MHCYAARSGQRTGIKLLVDPVTERAGIAALDAQLVERLVNDEGNRRLAIRSGDPGYIEFGGWPTIKAVAQRAKHAAETRHGKRRHVVGYNRRLYVGTWLPRDSPGTGTQGLIEKVEPVSAAAGAGEKQSASFDVPTVARDIGHAQRRDKDVGRREQFPQVN